MRKKKCQNLLQAGIITGFLLDYKRQQQQGQSRSRGNGGYGGYRRRGRYGRSVAEDEPTLLQASLVDSDDCAKMFVCQLNTIPAEKMSEFEREVYEDYGKNGTIDVTSEGVEFDLAALTGRLAGKEQCERLYGRCSGLSYDRMLHIAAQSSSH